MHLWGYRDFEDRRTRRAAMEADPDWTAYEDDGGRPLHPTAGKPAGDVGAVVQNLIADRKHMKVVISDDYQNCIRTLDCYPALTAHFDVEIRNDTVTALDAIAERFADADAMLLVRERTPVSAALLARRLAQVHQPDRARRKPRRPRGLHGARHCGVGGRLGHTAAAELTWALVMASMRKVHLEAARLAAGLWQGHLGVGLKGHTLGIAKYSKIGSVVAGYGRAFGMRVVALGRPRKLPRRRRRPSGVETQTDRAAFSRRSRCGVLPPASLRCTRGSITINDLSAMKPTALFVNDEPQRGDRARCARKRAESGPSGFAAVDVYEREPIYGADHPLLGLDNVLATPHIAYVEKNTYEHYFGIAIEQLLAWRAGAPINVTQSTGPHDARGKQAEAAIEDAAHERRRQSRTRT